eukprot:gene13214-9060_t
MAIVNNNFPFRHIFPYIYIYIKETLEKKNSCLCFSVTRFCKLFSVLY